MVSLSNEHILLTLSKRAVSSPDEFLVKNFGLRKNVRAITAFCRCISTTRRMRSVQRSLVSMKSVVPMPAPVNSPKMGRRSLASPVGMMMSNIILFAIGVNMPNKASTKAAANRSTRFVIDIDLKANFSSPA